MATNTTNYNLSKPALTASPPDITAQNANWDIIDSELKRLSNIALPEGLNLRFPTDSTITNPAITKYIDATNGNDSNSGDEGSPMQSLRAVIAKYGGMQNLVVKMAAGTYYDVNNLLVNGRNYIRLEPAVEGAVVKITTPYHQYGGHFVAVNIQFVSTSADVAACTISGGSATFSGCTFTSPLYGVAIIEGSVAGLTNCTFTNCATALYAASGSCVFASGMSGTGNTTGYLASSSLIAVGNTTLSATTMATKTLGGLIFRNGNLMGSTANSYVSAS